MTPGPSSSFWGWGTEAGGWPEGSGSRLGRGLLGSRRLWEPWGLALLTRAWLLLSFPPRLGLHSFPCRDFPSPVAAMAHSPRAQNAKWGDDRNETDAQRDGGEAEWGKGAHGQNREKPAGSSWAWHGGTGAPLLYVLGLDPVGKGGLCCFGGSRRLEYAEATVWVVRVCWAEAPGSSLHGRRGVVAGPCPTLLPPGSHPAALLSEPGVGLGQQWRRNGRWLRAESGNPIPAPTAPHLSILPWLICSFQLGHRYR